VSIAVFCDKSKLFIPNSFTPNGDGFNDRFYIKGFGLSKIKHLSIFNRWGQLVFDKNNMPVNDESEGWDGSLNGIQPDKTGAYVYTMDVVCKDGQEFSYKGTILLIK
jgi:gliding motility-associated-like protein